MATTPSSLETALYKAQQDVTPLEHDATGFSGRDEFQYTSAETIIDASRQILLANGLLARRCGWKAVLLDPENHNLCNVHCDFLLFHLESGEKFADSTDSLAQVFYGQTLEKAVNACLTRSLAYWLRDLLLIPRFHVETEPTEPSKLAAADPHKVGNDAFTMAMQKIHSCDTLVLLAKISERVESHPDLSDTAKTTLRACVLAKQQDLEVPHDQA